MPALNCASNSPQTAGSDPQPGAVEADFKTPENHLADRHLVNQRIEPVSEEHFIAGGLAFHGNLRNDPEAAG